MKIKFEEMQAEMAALQKKMAEFEKQQAPEPYSGRVALNADEAKWILFSSGQVVRFVARSEFHMGALAQGNAFTTRKAAEQARDRRELIQEMRVAASKGVGSERWYPVWDREWIANKEESRGCTSSQLPHFGRSTYLTHFMDKLTPDQQRLLICGVV